MSKDYDSVAYQRGVQEPLEMMLQKMCASVLREMQPQAVEAEQATKQARAQLRDRFAEAALTGLLANGWVGKLTREQRAAHAWQEADAMLKARGDE